ncbi:MAG: reverse transcriptase domain-containing protein [Parcubacteria group bacterium]
MTTRHVQRFLQREHRLTTSEAWVISRLLTLRGKIRQGAPISGDLFNAMLRSVDQLVLTILSAPNALEVDQDSLYLWHHQVEGMRDLFTGGNVYTRYADDLCFSAPDEQFDLATCAAIQDALTSQGFEINEHKTVLSGEGHLRFPGVEIKRKRIEPDGMYVFRLGELLREGNLRPWQKEGHQAYLKSFGPEVYGRVVKFNQLEF